MEESFRIVGEAQLALPGADPRAGTSPIPGGGARTIPGPRCQTGHSGVFPATPGPATDPPMKKAHLPTKVCAACARPFSWRKKWERDWDRVLYCSDACRRGVHPLARRNAGAKA